ncbi:MAG TPA: UPF0104 family protein [Leptolyngbyaceae cyanobacterium M65_K2018_010]|nr:UPF0104 family protein [Leptolyngbyaceae cyanobacterium M65_K2018_010]
MTALRVWLSRLKPYVRWGVLAAAIAFLGRTVALHWAEVTATRLTPVGLGRLGLGLGVTLMAHSWSGWVWGWLLQALQQPVQGHWSTRVYLQTNLWKYLPGNVWHFYGRLRALRGIGVPPSPAVMGVVLEPILMAVAALILGLVSPTRYWPWQLVLLGLILVGIRPRWLNPLIQRLGRAKTQDDRGTTVLPSVGLQGYPLKPLLGELGFVLLRGLGFGLVVSAVSPLPGHLWPSVVSLFSLAWLAGLVVPGAPGGLGVFEAIAVTLLEGMLSAGVVLSAVALYRLVSTLAEALGAGLAWLVERLR